MRTITFKKPQRARSLLELLENLDTSITVEKAVLSNVSFTKTKFKPYWIVLGVFIIIASALMDKGMEFLLDGLFEEIGFSRVFIPVLVVATFGYIFYVRHRNQSPKSDVVLLSKNEVYILDCSTQDRGVKHFKKAINFDFDEIKRVKEYPTNFLKTRFSIELDRGDLLFFEQNNFWNKSFFVGRYGIKQKSFVDVLKSKGTPVKGANEFAELIVNIMYVISLIIPFAVAIMMVQIENSLRDSVYSTSEGPKDPEPVGIDNKRFVTSDKNKFSESSNETDNTNTDDKSDVIKDQLEKIKRNNILNFIKAEDSRDFEKIYSHFTNRPSRYYDMENPTKQQLKERYEYIWSFTSLNNNNVQSITKVSLYLYDIETVFTYYNQRDEQFYRNTSKLRFQLGWAGNIDQVYALESNNEKLGSFGTSKKETRTTSNSQSPPPNTQEKPEYSYQGAYNYKTSFDNPLFEIPLREGANVSSRAIYKCPKDAKVYVLDTRGEQYYRVHVNGYTGYVSKNTLKRKY